MAIKLTTLIERLQDLLDDCSKSDDEDPYVVIITKDILYEKQEEADIDDADAITYDDDRECIVIEGWKS